MQYVIGFVQFLVAMVVLAFGLACVFFVITVAWVMRFILILIALLALIVYAIREVFSRKPRRSSE